MARLTLHQLLGTQEWYVIHNSLETAVLGAEGFSDVGPGPGSKAGDFINWLTISDQHQSVIDDVRRIREHPLVPRRIPIYGLIYQVETGVLGEIEEASAVGAAR
jgi:carbonic anhydrase